MADDRNLNERELTGNDALRFAREAGMEEASAGNLFYAGVGDLIRFARLVRHGWTPPRPDVATPGAYEARVKELAPGLGMPRAMARADMEAAPGVPGTHEPQQEK